MKINQIASLLNVIFNEMSLGENIVTEDLSNITDVGKQILSSDDFPYDSYVRKLVNRIGYTIYSMRDYRSNYGNYLKKYIYDWGSILQKVRYPIELPVDDDMWNLVDGATYNQDVFTAPKVTQKLFNTQSVFKMKVSITSEQVKESFNNENQMISFINNVYANIQRSKAAQEDFMSSRAINSMILRTIQGSVNSTDEAAIDDFLNVGNVRCVNLLKLYNDLTSSSLTTANCLNNEDFLIFAVEIIARYSDRLKSLTSMFNEEGFATQSPKESQRAIMLSDFYTAISLKIKSKTFHDNYIVLPEALTIPCWQGTGTSFNFDDISMIQGTVNGASFTATGVLGVLYDEEAVGLFGNYLDKVTVHYNALGDFNNFFYHYKIGMFNDMSENFVIFYIREQP